LAELRKIIKVNSSNSRASEEIKIFIERKNKAYISDMIYGGKGVRAGVYDASASEGRSYSVCQLRVVRPHQGTILPELPGSCKREKFQLRWYCPGRKHITTAEELYQISSLTKNELGKLIEQGLLLPDTKHRTSRPKLMG